MTPEAILEALSADHPEAPTALLREAAEHRETLVEPLLVALSAWVEKVCAPDSILEDGEASLLPEFAMYLLAQFREPRAFPLLLRLCRMSSKTSDYWLGDILTTDIPALLASTCANDHAPLEALLLDASVNSWARWAGCDALLTRVMHGDLPAEDLVRMLTRAASTEDRSPDNPFWSMLANAQHNLAHPALMPILREADADDLIDPGAMTMEELEQRLLLDRAEIEKTARAEYDYVRDAASAMHWLIENHDGPAAPDEDLDEDAFDPTDLPPQLPYVRVVAKIGRNDPCPCGSGKKYKKCHLDLDTSAPG
ncbi:MAG: DUF1186 domain-containing protein [Panacagrimonas sp.]